MPQSVRFFTTTIKRAEEAVKRVVNNNLDTRIAMARLLMAVEKRREDSGDTKGASSTVEPS